MKKRVLVILTIAVFSLFTACKSEETQDTKEPRVTKEPEVAATTSPTISPTVAPTQKPDDTTKPEDSNKLEDTNKSEDYKLDTEASKAIREVLLGEREFISTDEDNEKTTISDFDYYYGDKVEKTYWGDFLVVDFDGDGNIEVVVEVHAVEDSPMPQMEILHYEDGVVYGYQVTAKGMEEPNTDGMFYCDSSISRLEFDKDKYTYIHYVEKGSELEQFYLSLSEEQQKNNRLEYVEDEDKVYEEYKDSPEVRYYEFTKANIEMYVRPISFNIEVEQIGEEEIIEWNITVKRIADGFTQKINMKKDEIGIGCLPSANNMVRVEDVNFDGYDDIIIHKAYYGAQGASGYEAYIWDESSKELIHEESFLEIPNHEIDYERKLITGSVRQSSLEHDELVYKFQDGEFVNVATLSLRFDEDNNMVHVSVQKNEDGKLSEKVYGAVSYERYKEIYEQMLETSK